MDAKLASLLCRSIADVKTSRDFEDWVRIRLRKVLPHAAFLMTLGKLYSGGSLPTHRIGVDYPLSLVEDVKTRNGAINDPLVCEFLKNERLSIVSAIDWSEKFQGDEVWCKRAKGFGITSMMVYGLLDHDKRQFAIVQILNPLKGGSPEAAQILKLTVGALANAAWRTVEARDAVPARSIVGHPTASLTETELKIVQFLALGLSNKEIARRRGVSDSTIKTQVSRTGAKLGASRRSEIVAVGMSMIASLPAQGRVNYDE